MHIRTRVSLRLTSLRPLGRPVMIIHRCINTYYVFLPNFSFLLDIQVVQCIQPRISTLSLVLAPLVFSTSICTPPYYSTSNHCDRAQLVLTRKYKCVQKL